MQRLNKNFSVIIPNPTNNNEGTKVALKKTEKERIINEKYFLLILSSFLIFLQRVQTHQIDIVCCEFYKLMK